jgi:transposase
MGKARREFTPEFKREAGALFETGGRPQMQIAAELGIQPSMLRNGHAVLHGEAPRTRSVVSVPVGSATAVGAGAGGLAATAVLVRTGFAAIAALARPNETPNRGGAHESLTVANAWASRSPP